MNLGHVHSCFESTDFMAAVPGDVIRCDTCYTVWRRGSAHWRWDRVGRRALRKLQRETGWTPDFGTRES